MLHLPVVNAQTTIIKEGFLPTTVYRIHLEYAVESGPRSLVLKCAKPHWGGDPLGAEREARIYNELLPHIPIPRPELYFTLLGGDENETLIALQDLDDAYVFYRETHAWIWAEAQAILRAYAGLHVAAQSLGVARCAYLMPPLRTRWTPEDARGMFDDLASAPSLSPRLVPIRPLIEILLSEMPALEALAAREPRTLVHYDAYPPNVGFPRSGDASKAVLIDWALASVDIGEMDIAALFQQPYGSDALLDWRVALRSYCDEKQRLTGEPYDWDERVMLLRYARIQALFTNFVPIHVAWKKAREQGTEISPNAADPYARYYDAMVNVLRRIIRELTH